MRANNAVRARAKVWVARVTMVATLLLMALGLWLAIQPQPAWGPPPPATHTDQTLYRSVAAQMADGVSYYDAVASEHRRLGFPLAPVVAVRAPLLAQATVLVGGAEAMQRALLALVVTVVAALGLRFTKTVPHLPTRLVATGIAAIACGILLAPGNAMHHDIWAGLLATLALALRTDARWWPSLLIGLVAACLRELALPFLVAMAAVAVVERRWREAVAWSAALAVALLYLALHWMQVAAIEALPGDVFSPGWSGLGGWLRLVTMYANSSVLVVLPLALAWAAVPLAVLGLAFADRSMGPRAALWVGGMSVAFMIFARPDNPYWGALVAPLLAVGLAFVPNAWGCLARTADWTGAHARGRAKAWTPPASF